MWARPPVCRLGQAVKRTIVLTFALCTAWLAAPSTAEARSVITSPAGCNSEFKGNKGIKSSCNVCVKNNGRFKQDHKRRWACVAKPTKPVVRKPTRAT